MLDLILEGRFLMSFKRATICFVLVSFLPTFAVGQVLDMRSLSRQRGYTNYEQPVPSSSSGQGSQNAGARANMMTNRMNQIAEQANTQQKNTRPSSQSNLQAQAQLSAQKSRRQNASNVVQAKGSHSEDTRDYILSNPHVQPDL